MLIQINSPPKESFVKESVDKSLERLLIEDADLLEVDINERAITHKLAKYLESYFYGWNVDCEYNRNHYDPKRLNIQPRNIKSDDIKARTVYPDIIVHKRNTEENLLVIEFKKSNNREDEDYDLNKLQAFQEQLGYKYAAFIKIYLTDKKINLIFYVTGGIESRYQCSISTAMSKKGDETPSATTDFSNGKNIFQK